MFPISAFLFLVGWSSILRAHADSVGLEFFENRIRPILAAHCYECHSDGAEKVKGDLKLDTREGVLKGGIDGAVVIPGDPDASLLLRAIRYADADLRMPPERNGGKPLPDAVVADFVAWVKMGAPLPTSPAGETPFPKRPWALEPLADPSPPAVEITAWAATSIDRFVLAGLEAQGLRPSAPADRLTLIRRVTFDLTGLPPTPAEIDAFLADASQEAFATVVDRLLASPRYGEHWGRRWLDIVRYADTAGDTADYPLPEAWKYRNYVIDSFNADKPYDQFVQEQIAGDILARRGPREKYAEQVTATGFLALSRRFGFDSENYHHLTIQDTLDTLGQSILGLTLGCARCHDHKFDPVSMADYYALYGIFESTRYAFPGSEQKGRYRAMVPLAPPEESQPKWREFQSRFVALGLSPGAVLRSLDDLDGDFEMQRFAAGGSNGVLVPPWHYEGKVSVTQAAQSPFRNLYPFGSVGASVAPDAGAYAVWQTFRSVGTPGLVRVNLDFRVAVGDPAARGRHRFAIGPQMGVPAVEILLSSDRLTIAGTEPPLVIPFPRPGDWQNLQLALDPRTRTLSGAVGVPDAVTAFGDVPLAAEWKGALDSVALDSPGGGETLPGLEIDNLGLQDAPIAAVSAIPAGTPAPDAGLAALNAELAELSGFDGDLEMQQEGQPPVAPWHPGPNSAVKIVTASQSPYRNHFPGGKLGISLPHGGDYNGLGLNLPKPWTAESADVLHVGFDFRCADGDAGGTGTWRFHLGHGPGSAAVELGFNSREFFLRSGEARERVAVLQPGQWHQVQLTLNLRDRTCVGTVGTPEGLTAFAGEFARGWDGTITYVFIDSGGHINGVKPALDADNFVIGIPPLPPLGAAGVEFAGDERVARQTRIAELRGRIDALAAETAARQEELTRELASGPVSLAYAVSEGTPHPARIQIRGEPGRAGAEVPRGFIAALGGGALPPETVGSGRLELAQWLTRKENPLTARVMANRLWQSHFGRPLARTPNDFGNRSEPPTHPELLDHLAMRFMEGGWSVKAMHRLIVLSATWRQATATGAPDPAAANLYAGFPRRRLSAEEIRDAILSVSGEWDPTPGEGHPFPPSPTWGYSQHAPFTAVYDHNRRSVYLMVQRIKRHPFLALFDGADPNSSTAERRITTVPTQALYFLNDPFVHEKALKGAGRLLDAGADETARITLASRLVFGRPPTEEEIADASAFLADYRAELAAAGKPDPSTAALAAYLRTLFGSNEFLHCD